MSRRWRYPRARRGRFLPIVPAAQIPTAPAFVPPSIKPAGLRVRAAARPRRGKFYSVVVAAPVVQAPVFVPDWAGARRFVVPPVRRRSRPVVPSPTSVAGVSSPATHANRLALRVRRGRVLLVPPPQLVVGPAPLVPSFKRPPLRLIQYPRRPRQSCPPWIGQAPTPPPPVPPQLLRPAGQAYPSQPRRRRPAAPIPSGFIPPSSQVPHRTRGLVIRSGQFLGLPLESGPTPSLIQPIRLFWRQIRRGRFMPLVPGVAAVRGPVTVRRTRRQSGLLVRSGVFWPVPLVGLSGPPSPIQPITADPPQVVRVYSADGPTVRHLYTADEPRVI